MYCYCNVVFHTINGQARVSDGLNKRRGTYMKLYPLYLCYILTGLIFQLTVCYFEVTFVIMIVVLRVQHRVEVHHWRRRWHVPPKHWEQPARLYTVTSQKSRQLTSSLPYTLVVFCLHYGIYVVKTYSADMRTSLHRALCKILIFNTTYTHNCTFLQETKVISYLSERK